jgi:hypothetical protein
LVLEFVVLVVGLESLQEVSLLGILPLELTTGMVREEFLSTLIHSPPLVRRIGASTSTP